ncbi:MAG: restriction endonuclease subunit S [Candidatus Competibacteraceae bacterium]
MLSLPLQLPRLDEQQKIADCLSSIDALIVAQATNSTPSRPTKKG